MPENDTLIPENTTAIEQKVASLGKIQRIEIPMANLNNIPATAEETTNTEVNTDNQNTEGANATSEANNGAAAANATTAPAPTITDDQLREYFKSQGIDYDGIDKLKEKLTSPTQQIPETDEQIKAKELAKEKRIVDKFISGGGIYDQYNALKAVANAPIEELSRNTLKKELKDAGFSETEVEGIIKERYYQFADEDLDQFEEETDKEFAKRKKEYGNKLLSNRSLPIKNQAAGILASIQASIDAEDLQAQNELKVSTNIDEQFKSVSLKDTYEIGKINGKDIPPIESEVPQAEINAVHKMLKDPAQRQQLLFNEDGSLNITKISNLLIENAKLKAAMKVSYHESSTRTNEAWQKIFPARSAQEIGIGGSTQRPNGQQNNQPVKTGKVQRFQTQPQSQRQPSAT